MDVFVLSTGATRGITGAAEESLDNGRSFWRRYAQRAFGALFCSMLMVIVSKSKVFLFVYIAPRVSAA
jgi:hypothetical protein